MRFRHRQDSSIPAINLIPMLNVLLGVLAFFVIITMTLGQPRGITVNLPADAEAPPPPVDPLDESTPPLIVHMSGVERYFIDDAPVPSSQLGAVVLRHLGESEDTLVFITADRRVPYEDVLAFLIEMKQLGGDRVSLALDEAP